MDFKNNSRHVPDIPTTGKRYGTFFFILLTCLLIFNGCIRYGFTGTSIPEGVNLIYIPFFANQTSSGVPDLSDRLNNVLINRFINQSSLQLANNRGSADAILEGSIIQYSVEPFSITGEDQADQNQVTIVVQASYQYTEKQKQEQEQGYNKRFSGSATYDPNESPIEGETNAAQEALEQIANNMFNDAVSGW